MCVCVCVKPGPFLSSCSRELVFPDLGVAGAASSCSSAAHANSMNHFPSFQSSEIKAYGGRKRRGGMFYLDLYHHSIKLRYQTECGKKREDPVCICMFVGCFQIGSEGQWKSSSHSRVHSPGLIVFLVLAHLGPSVLSYCPCAWRHTGPERNREGPHMESEAPGSIRPVWSALPGPKSPRFTACHWISDLLIKFAPLSSFKVMKCLSLPSPPGYRWRGPISPSE